MQPMLHTLLHRLLLRQDPAFSVSQDRDITSTVGGEMSEASKAAQRRGAGTLLLCSRELKALHRRARLYHRLQHGEEGATDKNKGFLMRGSQLAF